MVTRAGDKYTTFLFQLASLVKRFFVLAELCR
jgi:hypothetical protein